MAKKSDLAQIQQGDVLFQAVTAIPGAARPVQAGHVIVAQGEHTGHAHVIDSDQAVLYELTHDGMTDRYVELKAPSTVVHEEHKALLIPAGIYHVGIVKEFDHLAAMERAVID